MFYFHWNFESGTIISQRALFKSSHVCVQLPCKNFNSICSERNGPFSNVAIFTTAIENNIPMVDSINDMNKICRLCLKDSEEFVFLNNELSENITVVDVFNFCTNLNAVENDGLPQKICIECLDDLSFSYNFIQKAKESDSICRSIDQTDQISIFSGSVCSGLFLYENEKNLTNQKEKNSIGTTPQNNEFQDENSSEFGIHDCELIEDETNHLQMTVEPYEAENQSIPCDLCTEVFSSKSERLAHKREFHKKKKSNSQLICEYCGKRISTIQQMQVHHTIHTNNKQYKCEGCSKSFATVYRLREHERTHTGDRQYKCDQCDKSFYKRHGLICHKRLHTGERPYVCKVCGKTFTQFSIMKTHLTLHTGKNVECPICKKKFSRPSNLILHSRSHTGERPYVCHYCSKSYKQKSHLESHMHIHIGKRHKCEICAKEYSQKSTLYVHMLSHSNEKRYECPKCPEVFINRNRQVRHIKKKHSLPEPKSQKIDEESADSTALQ